jgi:hypothetical protein
VVRGDAGVREAQLGVVDQVADDGGVVSRCHLLAAQGGRGGRPAVPDQLLAAVAGLDGYDLRHALLREVIDADLLPGERARLHAALAHTLANLLGSGELDWSDSAAEVAAHWGRAHDLSKALEWLVRAAFASSALASRPPR